MTILLIVVLLMLFYLLMNGVMLGILAVACMICYRVWQNFINELSK